MPTSPVKRVVGVELQNLANRYTRLMCVRVCACSRFSGDSRIRVCTIINLEFLSGIPSTLFVVRASRKYYHASVTGWQNSDARETAREYRVALKSM